RAGQAGEALGVSRPVEVAGVDDHATDGGAVAADELRRGVHDDVDTVVERTHQVGRGGRVVDDEGQTLRVRSLGPRVEVDDVDLRVADGLAEDQLGLLVDVLGEVL